MEQSNLPRLGRVCTQTAVCGIVVVAMMATACAKPNLLISPTRPDAVERPVGRVSDNVIIVSIDGLRPDAIATFKATTLTRLMNEGSYTLAAHTILPSKTLPSHTSMLTGEPPDRHGILWNTAFEDAPGTLAIPTVFSEARSRGYQTAAFFSKAKFSHLQSPGTLDYAQSPGGWFGRWSASRTLSDVETYLSTSKPNLLFVHLPDPDNAGHAYGWMSYDYGAAVRKADKAVGRLIVAADRAYGSGQYTLIVTADHGGHGTDHGSNDPRDVTIPWIAWGRGVIPGHLSGTVHTMDTAATALYVLGIRNPPAWAGAVVRPAFGVTAEQ